ncbi:hypothetical protein [Breoghania sp.]|nr:hypothetical protein [Breoghania sp.]MDJ0931551.1 hypothetical protein [Breoghania sp.]
MHAALGAAYRKAGREKLAEQSLQRALALEPEHIGTLQEYGNTAN